MFLNCHVHFAVGFHHVGLQCKSVITYNEVWDVIGLLNVAQIWLALSRRWLGSIAVGFVIKKRLRCWSVEFSTVQVLT